MLIARQLYIRISLIASGLILSSCALKDLKDDLDMATEEYGYFKGQISGFDDRSDVLIGLFRREQDSMTITNFRTVNSGESLYMLVPKAGYSVLAFADSNGDFNYQPGEPAARIDDPIINWFSDMQGQDRVDYAALQVQQIELTKTTVLDQKLDFSMENLREATGSSENFLRVVSWDEERFSDDNMQRGMWEPVTFQEEVGFGLYVLREFDPTQKSVLLVHGILDTPRRFESLANAIPADYQVLLFHYPSGFPLEHTSYVLGEALDALVRRNQIPQLDIIAHSMGGLVSKGMLYQADDAMRQRMRLFISIASPFGGHEGAASGIKWGPVVAPAWWAMAPNSPYLQTIDGLDLSKGPRHHLIFSFSHEAGGKSEGDDGVVTVKSQLTSSAQRNATALYGIADGHVGVASNPCTAALVTAILQDGSARAVVPEC
jgi:pimeloyl-ACP methyl ester carboxylesterase